MKKAILVCFLVLSIFFDSLGQVTVGQVFDMDGSPCYGTLDLINYAPQKSLLVRMAQRNYTRGKFMDSTGVLTNKQVKYYNGSLIEEVPSHINGYKKLKGKDYEYVLIGSDSIISIKNYVRYGKIKTKPIHVIYLDSIQKMEFFSRTLYPNNYETEPEYFIKHVDSTQFISFHIDDKTKFNKLASQYFGHVPSLKDGLNRSFYSEKDIPKFIKELRFHQALTTGKPIQYNKFNKIETNSKKVSYLVHVLEYNGKHWVVEYSNHKHKTYTACFSKLFPITLDSTFLSYHANGQIHKKIDYKKNKVESTEVFSDQGELMVAYSPSTTDPYANNPKVFNVYATTPNNGKPTTAEITVYDSITKKEIHQRFNEGKLEYSYYLKEDSRIYQVTSNAYKPKLSKLQKKIDLYSYNRAFGISINARAEGYSVYKLLVNEKGNIDHINILYSSFGEQGHFIPTYLRTLEGKKTNFGVYKVDGKPVKYEVILPVNFILHNWYIRDTYYQDHYMFQNNQNYYPDFSAPQYNTYKNF